MFPKLLKQVNVAETINWKKKKNIRQLICTVWTMGMVWKTKDRAGVLPACCDIDRAWPSLMQQCAKLW